MQKGRTPSMCCISSAEEWANADFCEINIYLCFLLYFFVAWRLAHHLHSLFLFFILTRFAWKSHNIRGWGWGERVKPEKLFVQATLSRTFCSFPKWFIQDNTDPGIYGYSFSQTDTKAFSWKEILLWLICHRVTICEIQRVPYMTIKENRKFLNKQFLWRYQPIRKWFNSRKSSFFILKSEFLSAKPWSGSSFISVAADSGACDVLHNCFP